MAPSLPSCFFSFLSAAHTTFLFRFTSSTVAGEIQIPQDPPFHSFPLNLGCLASERVACFEYCQRVDCVELFEGTLFCIASERVDCFEFQTVDCFEFQTVDCFEYCQRVDCFEYCQRVASMRSSFQSCPTDRREMFSEGTMRTLWMVSLNAFPRWSVHIIIAPPPPTGYTRRGGGLVLL